MNILLFNGFGVSCTSNLKERRYPTIDTATNISTTLKADRIKFFGENTGFNLKAPSSAILKNQRYIN